MSGLVLVRPKYPHNVAAAIRAASCFGIDTLLWTGHRFEFKDGERLPREERMKGYADVTFREDERPLETLPGTPVCIELTPSARSLTDFQHPEDAIYVFGPEDGSVPWQYRRLCHHFVYIPSQHCLNLSAAINVVLYDRAAKRQVSGAALGYNIDSEQRGWIEIPGWEGK